MFLSWVAFGNCREFILCKGAVSQKPVGFLPDGFPRWFCPMARRAKTRSGMPNAPSACPDGSSVHCFACPSRRRACPTDVWENRWLVASVHRVCPTDRRTKFVGENRRAIGSLSVFFTLKRLIFFKFRSANFLYHFIEHFKSYIMV